MKKLRPTDQQRRNALIAAIHEIITRTNVIGPYKYVLGRVASKQRTAFTALTIYNLPDSNQLLGDSSEIHFPFQIKKKN